MNISFTKVLSLSLLVLTASCDANEKSMTFDQTLLEQVRSIPDLECSLEEDRESNVLDLLGDQPAAVLLAYFAYECEQAQIPESLYTRFEEEYRERDPLTVLLATAVHLSGESFANLEQPLNHSNALDVLSSPPLDASAAALFYAHTILRRSEPESELLRGMLLQAAELGHATALYEYVSSLPSPAESPDEYFGVLQCLASEDYVPALAALGLVFRNGHLVDQSLVDAQRLWERAARQGSSWAANMLGELYLRSTGSQFRSYEKAMLWFTVAETLGDSHVTSKLTALRKEVEPASIQQIESAARKLVDEQKRQNRLSFSEKIAFLVVGPRTECSTKEHLGHAP